MTAFINIHEYLKAFDSLTSEKWIPSRLSPSSWLPLFALEDPLLLIEVFKVEILTSIHAFDVLRRHMTSDVEEFWVLALSPNLSLLQIKCISRGTVDACPVHPRDIFRFACLSNASQLILAHNHPDGYLEPSENDLKLTRTCIQIGRILQIPIADHLLIGSGEYSSFLEKNWCVF